MSFDPRAPYNELPLLPPEQELESKEVLKKAITANKALAELKGAGELVPNQAVLIQAIGLQEAKLSSEIENIVTTNDELYRAFASDGQKAEPHTKEVLRYNDALWFGYYWLKDKNYPLTTNLFEELFRIIKESKSGIRKVPGTKLANDNGDVIYTPPEGESVLRDKLGNLEKYIYASDSVDPLIKLAVVHYQFEAVHPFTDGNGRTGRILNLLYLIEQGLLNIPILYLSRYIIENKKDYYAGLRCVTEKGNWKDWILYMLNAVEQTSIDTRKKILSIRDLMHRDVEIVRKKLPKIYSKDLLELLYRQPYCKISMLEKAGIAKRQTASIYLKELENIGILRAVKMGRDIYYINDDFLHLLTN
ncbi:MAG: Fic family protein [Desulfobacterales bacterium]|nr:Fic family protein [Desulfobacterales bacterium]